VRDPSSERLAARELPTIAAWYHSVDGIASLAMASGWRGKAKPTRGSLGGESTQDFSLDLPFTRLVLEAHRPRIALEELLWICYRPPAVHGRIVRVEMSSCGRGEVLEGAIAMGWLVRREKEQHPSAVGGLPKRIGWWLTLPVLFSGCADGPLYGLKKMNPVITKQWKTDQELGPTYVQRLEEIQRLRSQIRTMSTEEQAGWLDSIEQLVGNDPSPEMRRQAVLALKGLPQQEADEILSNASKDESEKVRLAACEVLSAPPNPTRLALLEKLARQDESMAVRIAAVERLGDFSSDQALAPLEEALRDKSPALQYAAVQSLAKTTGLKMSANVAQWRDYLEQNRDSFDSPDGSNEAAGILAGQGERPVR
jgi:hypothetical protein